MYNNLIMLPYSPLLQSHRCQPIHLSMAELHHFKQLLNLIIIAIVRLVSKPPVTIVHGWVERALSKIETRSAIKALSPSIGLERPRFGLVVTGFTIKRLLVQCYS